MEIGEILREAREANNLSLDDIQETTKIQKRYLVAIEQNDFHALPGRFYARAFIKEYAQAVGLDAKELLAEFDEEEIVNDEETVQYTRLERSKRPRVAKSSSILSLLPSIIVVILVIGIIFVAWTLTQKTLNDSNVSNNEPENDEIIRNVEENEPNEELDDEEEANSEENDGQEEKTNDQASGEFSVVEVGTGSSPLSTLDFTYSDDKVEVNFDVSAATYIELKGDSGKVYYTGTVDAGTDMDPIDVSDEEKIYFNIGNVPGLTVSINGIEMEYPVSENEKVHQKLWINLLKK